MSEHELRPGAREIVAEARAAQTPGNAQRDRAYEALMASIAGGATLGAAKLSAAKVAGSAAVSGTKWLFASAGIVAVAATGYFVSMRRHAPVAPVPPAGASVASASAPEFAGPAAAVSASASANAVENGVPSAAPPAVSVPSSTSKAPPKTNGGDLSEELSLLHQALAASRAGNPARALALAQQHQKEFPSSHLGVERDAIEVRSLCSLGRAAEAHKIADRLQARAPGSPVRAALEETCVGK